MGEQVTTYIVGIFEKSRWRTVLTTKGKKKAIALAKVRGEEITPKLK